MSSKWVQQTLDTHLIPSQIKSKLHSLVCARTTLSPLSTIAEVNSLFNNMFVFTGTYQHGYLRYTIEIFVSGSCWETNCLVTTIKCRLELEYSNLIFELEATPLVHRRLEFWVPWNSYALFILFFFLSDSRRVFNVSKKALLVYWDVNVCGE